MAPNCLLWRVEWIGAIDSCLTMFGIRELENTDVRHNLYQNIENIETMPNVRDEKHGKLTLLALLNQSEVFR